MKRVLFVLCCLAAVSCTQSTLLDENFPEDSKSQPVRMTASIRGSETRAELDETLGNGVFTEGDVFGLYVKKEGASTPVCSNETYLLKNAKWGPADSGKDSLFWNVLGIDKPHTFTACYPLQRVTAIEAHPFSVKNNQSGAVNYQNSDLLQATAQAQGGQVDLRFTHRMSRLVICVMTDSITSIKTVKNLNTSCTANLLTGETVSPGNPQDITPKQWTRIPSAGIPTGTKTVYEVLIPAQSLTNTIANRLNLLEVGTKTSAGTIVVQAPLTIKTTDDKEIPFDRLEADHQILLQATIQDHKVVLSAAQIQPWGIGGEADNGIRSYIGIATMQDLLDLGEYTVQYGGGYNLPAAIKDRFVEPGSDAILFWNDLNFDAESNSKYRSKIMTHTLNPQLNY